MIHGLVERFLDQLEEKQGLDFIVFKDDNQPIKFRARFYGINYEETSILFYSVDVPRLSGYLKKEKEIYSRFEDLVFIFTVLEIQDNYLLLSFPYLHYVPQKDRSELRVKCSLKNPCLFIYNSKTYNVLDISKGGFSIKLKEKLFDLDDKERGILSVNNRQFAIPFSVVYITEFPDGSVKYGMKFITPPEELLKEIDNYTKEIGYRILKVLSVD